MAIISEGEVLLTGKPLDVVTALQGKVWKKLIPRTDVAAHRQDLNVISSRLLTGQTLIHVYSDVQPDATFESVEADLEDVYFATLEQQPVAAGGGG
jgi:hypothetical protein